MSVKTLLPVKQDGGWGWVVIVGSFLVHVFADGFVYSFGVLVEDLVQEFNASNSYVAIIISLLTGLTLGFGPIASAVTNKYGCRTSTIIGSSIAATGCFLTFFAQSMIHIVLTVGIVMGCGIGLMYCPAIVVVTMYFERYRALATGIAVSGAGIGTWIFPLIYGYIREQFGWRYVFIAGSFFMASCALCGATFRPMEWIEKEEDTPHSESPAKSDDSKDVKDDDALLSPPKNKISSRSHDAIHEAGRSLIKGARSHGDVNVNHEEGFERKRSVTVTKDSGYLEVKGVLYTGSIQNVSEFQKNPDKFRSLTSLHSKKGKHDDKLEDVKEEGDDDVFEDDEKTTKCSSIGKTLARMLNLSLLREPVFLLFAVSNLLTSVGFNSPLYFLPMHATQGLNLTKLEGDSALSVFGIFNTLGRVSFGLVGDRTLPLPYGWGDDTARNRFYIYNISLTICGLLTCMSFLFTNFRSLCVYAGAFGFSISSYICLTSVILVDFLGLDLLTNAFGLLLLFQGVGTVFGPPIAGWLADVLGSYHPSFIFCGVNLLLSGVMMFTAVCVRQPVRTDSPSEARKNIALH